MNKSLRNILSLPVLCLICNQHHRGKFPVCNNCNNLLARLGARCKTCAHPLSDESFTLCGICSRQSFAFDSIITAYKFEEPLRTLLHQFKYHQSIYLTNFLTSLILEAIANIDVTTECLIPVPIHTTRLKSRGFNQAALIAKNLSRKLNIPYNINICKKIKNTIAQAQLSEVERKHNMQDAFSVQAVNLNHITLIDDLVTTGSTVNTLAQAFKRQGVTVSVWCCARA